MFKGAWYALEHGGQLLATAITLYNREEKIWLAVGLGILGLEEIGKCSQLLDWSNKVSARKKLPKRSQLIEKNHRVKQWRGILQGGVTYGLAADTTIGSLLGQLAASINNKPKFDEVGKKLTIEFKELREKSFYVDLKNYDAGWMRPDEACGDALACQVLILGTNSYARMREQLMSLSDSWMDRPPLPDVPEIRPSKE